MVFFWFHDIDISQFQCNANASIKEEIKWIQLTWECSRLCTIVVVQAKILCFQMAVRKLPWPYSIAYGYLCIAGRIVLFIPNVMFISRKLLESNYRASSWPFSLWENRRGNIILWGNPQNTYCSDCSALWRKLKLDNPVYYDTHINFIWLTTRWVS